MNHNLILAVLLLSTSLVLAQRQTIDDQYDLNAVYTEDLKVDHLNMMLQLRGKKDHQPVTKIDEDITLLKSELEKDQVAEDKKFAEDTNRINKAIKEEEAQIASLKITRQLWKDRITGYSAELTTINSIYQRDRSLYLQRLEKQSELINVLDDLIEKSQTDLLENPSVPALEGTGISAVLAQIKQIGHGHPIEALVQMNKLFTKNDAQSLISRFEQLKAAVVESQKIDQQKEDKNLQLFNVLTHNIEKVLIPQAKAQIEQINSEIKAHRARIAQLVEELRQITEIYNFRKEQRAKAIEYSTKASQTLQAELQELIKNEIYITNNSV